MWENSRLILAIVLGSAYLINSIFAVIIIFFERRNPKSVWAWLLLLLFLPGIGFLLYLLLGVDMHKRKMFCCKALEENLAEVLKMQEQQLKLCGERAHGEEVNAYKELVLYNIKASHALLFDQNDVDIITDGREKFAMLLKDLEEAKSFIHLQYYILRDDVLFSRILNILEEKVKRGVRVRIMFDSMGCRAVNRGFWKRLREKGIEVAEFFPAFLGRFQFRVNYRNHRKIAVIDNRVAYVGGFNIGKEYVGLEEKYGYWRDTHLRICGEAVLGLGIRFILDWNYAAGENLFDSKTVLQMPTSGGRDGCRVQIISSGPDNISEQIRDNYLRLIVNAKRKISIQTPYFIPDETILNALLMAVKSGVEVNLMIPCKPDHAFVYWATYSYMGELVGAGANCYVYNNGFLHCKGIVVDGEVLCYGTANLDIRSFALNFEVNAVVYCSRKARQMEMIFENDLRYCTHITPKLYGERSAVVRFKEQACRLLSPLL